MILGRSGHFLFRVLANSRIPLSIRLVTYLLTLDLLLSSPSSFDGLLISVYDVSSRQTFDELLKWFKEINTYCGEGVVKMVVGNKVDKVCTHGGLLSFALTCVDIGVLAAGVDGGREGIR